MRASAGAADVASRRVATPGTIVRGAGMGLVIVAACASPLHAERPEGALFWPSRIDYPNPGGDGVCALVDVTQDGLVDYVVARGITGGGAMVYRGTGEARFEPEPLRVFPAVQAYGVAVIDANADDRPDVVFLSRDAPVEVLIALPDGTLPDLVATPMPHAAHDPRIGKMDADDLPDVVVQTLDGLLIFRGEGDGSFGQPDTLRREANEVTRDFVLANLDGDAYTGHHRVAHRVPAKRIQPRGARAGRHAPRWIPARGRRGRPG